MSGHLIFGKPSLSMQHCEHCERETLHRFGVCVACGTGLSTLVPRLADFALNGVDSMRAARGGIRGRGVRRRPKYAPVEFSDRK